jgi:hypothetical protein
VHDIELELLFCSNDLSIRSPITDPLSYCEILPFQGLEIVNALELEVCKWCILELVDESKNAAQSSLMMSFSNF